MSRYQMHLRAAKSSGWKTTFCNGSIMQNTTLNAKEVTCKRCLAKIKKYKSTERGMKILNDLHVSV